MKQFEDQDLVLMAQIIDQSSQKGVFKGPDLKIIGDLYTKIVGNLPKQAPKEQTKDGKKQS